MTGKRGRRLKQLLDDLKGKRGYWKLGEEALDRTWWRTRFGRGRQRNEWIVKHLEYKNRTVYWLLYIRFILRRYRHFVRDASIFLYIYEVRFQFDAKRRLHWADMTKSSPSDVQRRHNSQISPRAVLCCRRWNMLKTKIWRTELNAFCAQKTYKSSADVARVESWPSAVQAFC